ncbi:MAG: methylenetetrahydrofolate reductase [NAD(P)H] [Candidatus Omnitrophica bacterium]|nr:methylenetetrahydrofolate reductase [NAD(P)H] [Candidatus Omnitrophota bacterium]
MKKLTDPFKEKPKTFSFELFPPKTEQGYQNLLATIKELNRLKPDFISCTYGAGGGNRDKTLDIVEHIQKEHRIPTVAHLTCVLNTKEEIRKIVEDIKSRGVQNILALRGDPPQDNPGWRPGKDNFEYSCELCAFIRKNFDGYFSLAVAGFPEGHILCKDRDKDAQYLKLKIQNGADFVMTQFFLNNNDYYGYVERLRKLNVNVRVIPGVLPITNYDGLVKFAAMNGSSIPEEVKKIFEPIRSDAEKTLKAGTDFAIKQCRDLLAHGAPGIHFYTLNKLEPTQEILGAVRTD